MHYDIIGDIHGCYQTLQALLDKLGYARVGEVYSHPQRQVIFLGDFIDRGPYQREVIELVQAMVAANTALAVMGNHEYNAIAYYTSDPRGGFLREHDERHTRQHQAFLNVFQQTLQAWADVIDWFLTLPLWLDLGELRVIHACWDKHAIERIKKFQGGSTLLSYNLLVDSCRKGTWQFDAIETILKGKELPLPEGQHFFDKDQHKRHNIRVRWWDDTATTFKNVYMGPESDLTHIPDDPIVGDHLVDYSHHDVPVFLGHYWLEGAPRLLAPNIACVDFSVAKTGGQLVAYRWDGEALLDAAKFVAVLRLEP